MSMPGLLSFFPGLEAEDLPDGEARAVEHVTLVSRHAAREAEDRLRGIQGNAGACFDLCEELVLGPVLSAPDCVIVQSIRSREDPRLMGVKP
jgi:hypothetical protein